MSGGLSLYLGNRVCSQAEFAEAVGISEARMSQLVGEGLFSSGQSALTWLRTYVERLREQAAGRDVDGVLVKERAGLAREQRIGQAIKNAVAQGEYAPIGLLSDVLGLASGAVAERLDGLVSRLKMVWPDMPEQAQRVLEATIASARNEWVEATTDLTEARLATLAQADDDVEPEAAPAP